MIILFIDKQEIVTMTSFNVALIIRLIRVKAFEDKARRGMAA